MTRPAFALFLLLGVPGLLLAQKFDTAGADALLKDALSRWNTPGLAAAIAIDDKVVYLKGFGVREAGKDDRVTAHTVFPFASVTKAFAATGLGILADEGKANWDDPVRKHLPWFRLFDPLADKQVRLRDLLCHRTGLASHNLLYYRASWDLEETVRRMAHLEPAISFRSRFEYNNLGYIAAGLAIEKASGMSWQEFTRKRLLTPLGMKDAVFTDVAARAVADHATPHRRDAEGKPRAIPWYPDAKQVRASGSLKGSATDLAAWLRLQLGDGIFEGNRLISSEALRETHRPQIVVGVDATLAKRTGATQHSYGLGWHITDYHGQLLIEHGGANDGFRARVMLLPRRKIGIALLANVEDTNFMQAVGYTLLDHVLGRKKSDWHEFYQKRAQADAEKSKQDKQRLLASRKKGTRPSRELAAYAGTFRDAAYGEAVVAVQGKELVLRWSCFRVAMTHFHHDTFLTQPSKDGTTAQVEGKLAAFALDADGNVARVKLLGRTFQRVK